MQLFYLEKKSGGEKYVLITNRNCSNLFAALVFTEEGNFFLLKVDDFPKTAEEIKAIKRKAFWDECPRISIRYKMVSCESKDSEQDFRIESFQVFDARNKLLFSSEDIVCKN